MASRHLVYFDTDDNEIRMVAEYCVKSVKRRDEDNLWTVELGGRCAPQTVVAMDVAWLEQNQYGTLNLELVPECGDGKLPESLPDKEW